MLKRTLFLSATFVLASCAHQPSSFVIGPQPAPPAAKGVDFAGVWDYNAGASDKPGQMGGLRGRDRMGGGGPDFSFGGRGEFGGGRGEQRPGGGRMEMDSTLRRPPLRLIIAQSDSTLTISPRDSVSYTLYFDGRDVVAPEMLGGSRISLHGQWHGKRFEVVRQMPSGMVVTQEYELKSHGKRLVIHVQLHRGTGHGPEMPEFQQVYDKE